MFTTCIHCTQSHGTNEAFEVFPVGSRLAFEFVPDTRIFQDERWRAHHDQMAELGFDIDCNDLVYHAERSHILDHLEQFRGDYEATPAENHRPNVPAALQSRIVEMVSLKSTHARGNVQLTLTRLRDPEEFLLDADIDESGELLRHLLDLFKHKV